MSTRDPKSDVLQLNLSRYHSLDVVRLPKSRKYRVVFAERFGVQRRAFVEISFDEAARLALFLANIEDGLRPTDEREETTNPGIPSSLPPAEVSEMLRQYLEPVIEPLPPPPEPRTKTPAQTIARIVGKEDDQAEENFDDPRTGVIPTDYLDDKPKKDD